MSLIDDLRQGAAFINDLDRNRIQHDIAPYQGGLSAAKLYEANTINRFLPDKLRLMNEGLGLANVYQGKVNQEYIPNILSEIAARRANTESTNIDNRFAPDRLRLANEHQQQVNDLYGEVERANIEKAKADAYFKMHGGAAAGVGQKDRDALQRQIQLDLGVDANRANQIMSAHFAGDETLPDGSPVPPLSGTAQNILATAQKRAGDAATRNQANNLDVLANDLNSIDIAPVSKFAGLKGGLSYGDYAAAEARGESVPQEFRDYETFKTVTSNFAMDALRKGFGTSVVPDYVYATLGKASQPNSKWWYDPKQVEQNWNATKKWINSNAAAYKKKATQGVSAKITSDKPSNSSGRTRTYNLATGRFE